MQGESRIDSLEKLREFVQATLCKQNELEMGMFPLTEQHLSQAGRLCGLHFCLHGPRSVKLVAIWESKNNTVLFYSSTSERLLKIPLAVSLPLATSGC